MQPKFGGSQDDVPLFAEVTITTTTTKNANLATNNLDSFTSSLR